MSIVDYRRKRLDRNQARKLVAKVMQQSPSNVRFSRHAMEEMEKDNLIVSDVLNVMKSPDSRIINEAEFERGSYRYRLETNKITVVIAFDSPTSFVVVTAWRENG